MRTKAEIVGMRDRIERDLLSVGGEANEAALIIFRWVCDRLVPDADLFCVTNPPFEDAEYELRAEDVGASLLDTVADDEWRPWTEYLSRLGNTQLKELAQAARKVDRLCKTEIKKRGVKA